ncbi:MULTISPECIES: MFS transporter [Rhizobium]|uniref:MFS transporter n=1 Tax=Rhizobium leguminosarum bv. viciae TaxID=387 RepID=A0A8I2KII8_RHILV|nr:MULTISPECIES: MFS transporter [Rhizobium]KAF5880331.1 MFS transporter [Rhizobium sp. PEPV16]MBY3131342.1 MFS transporter [Rhizobium laguerreae]MBY5753513.1 MFS transporter [Rhizobium leguminosarum]MBY5774391.1 MFS transporter [Rhizobium leguminosarum]MBY5785800.1 MFS transporter [Rhizobium leguminosarum]
MLNRIDWTGTQPPKATEKGIWGWMFFDWAAQPFFTVVTTFIFGPYFVSRLTDDPVSAQTTWSNMATISSVIIALLSPVLGSIADQSGARKPWIGFFAVIKIASLFCLWFAAPGSPVLYPVIFMILASISAEFSIVFNDSMMPRLVGKHEVGKLSNTAWGLGYLGGIIVLIAVVTLLAASPETGKTILGLDPLFGLDPETGQDARITGPISAVWYLIFILPMFFFTPDVGKGLPFGTAVRSGLRELKNTLGELRERRGILKFLIARMIYQDGVNGLLILGGIFAAGMFGWATIEIGIYGIILNVIAIFGCLIAGRIDKGVGSKVTVVISLTMLLLATIGIISTGPGYTLFGLMPLPTADSGGLFGTAAEKAYILYGLLIGLAFGPVQASSRSYLARSVNIEEAGRYFGIYALSGRATSFMATLLFSLVTYMSGSPRLGMATLILFLAGGLILLIRTSYPADRA